ncbi:AraC family transcriptional regulator [Actinopolymorpha sp. B11F2]|uniref:helix-turn-helix transcriptional regulator n=1 Tax=Actinopolymorpha sp. B11F2 TaxID=3160862 RepID=UPI0032E4C6AC
MGDRLDYRGRDVWTELAASLGRTYVPEPSRHCGHVRCGPEWSWRFSLQDFDLWLVCKGRGRGAIGDQPVTVSPGTLLVLRPGDTGWMVQDPDDRLTVTFAHFALVAPATGVPVDLPADRLPSRHLRLTDFRAVHEPLLSVVRLMERAGPLALLEARLVFAHLLLTIVCQDAVAAGLAPEIVDPRVQTVMRFVRERPAERPTIQAAAAVARVSPTHLRRLFAREVGMSFRSYVLRSRMEQARSMLCESAMSVSEIARALGYVDVALFSRQVRAYFGMTPSDLRQAR